MPFAVLTALILSVTLLFTGCGSGLDNSGKNVFRYNESAGIITLDPAFSRDQAHIWACNQLYNSLVKLDDKLRIAPSVAKDWRISEDGKTYTFYLRTNVYFHENACFPRKTRKVIAEDFVFSFNRLLNPKTASPGTWVFSQVEVKDGHHSFKAINDTTLEIRLKEAFPPFLGILSMKYCSVLPKEAVDFYGDDLRNNPVGTGPFMYQNWIENIKLVLRKNPNYFEFENGKQLPYLDGVSVSFLIDKMTAFMEFVKGNFDFMSGIDPSYKDELLTRSGELKAKFRNRFRMIVSPYLNTEYLALYLGNTENQSDNPLMDIRIRQAINYGFDRAKMIKYLRNGIGTPGDKGIIPAGMLSYDSEADYGYSHNPEKSRMLVKEAGYNDLNPVPEISLTTTPDYLDLCKFVQSQLKDVGIRININVSPTATVREMKANGKLDFFRASWIADYPDEENYLSMFYSGNHAPNGPNYTHFNDPLVDSLYLATFAITNPDSRTSRYREIDSLIMDRAPVAILYYDQVTLFTQDNIEGLKANPINLLNLERVRISN